ncbi:hypothetical protein AAE478_008162 [Parahypoxylon ruwenzoriense]
MYSSKDILIVGSGAFGISTALWLARTGYTDATVLDMQDTASKSYDPLLGVDSASADLNKIVRFSYGKEIEYQRLATESAILWEAWNRELEQAEESELPEGLKGREKGERKLWWNVGMLKMSSDDELGEFEIETLRNMEKERIREAQFRTDDETDIQRAESLGWARKLDPCRRQKRFGTHKAVLNSTEGFLYAYRSCTWALHLARKSGVETVLDPVKGRVVDIKPNGREGGNAVYTADGREWSADLIVVAGGGWTPSLIHEAQNLLETTAGPVAMVKIPKDHQDL